MLEWLSRQSEFSGTRTVFTPAQLAIDATAPASIGPSKKLDGTERALAAPCGTHEYSPPERLTPHSTTVVPFASTRWLPTTWSPDVGIGAAAAGVAPCTATATAPTTSAIRLPSTRPVCLSRIARLSFPLKNGEPSGQEGPVP